MFSPQVAAKAARILFWVKKKTLVEAMIAKVTPAISARR